MSANHQSTLIGPFSQLLTMEGLPMKGPIPDSKLPVLEDAGVLVSQGVITKVGRFADLLNETTNIEHVHSGHVAMPAFVDSHTHICFGGSRARDYSSRISGKSYQQILQEGGGIYDSVAATRNTTSQALVEGLHKRLDRMVQSGVTTCEVKSGYGLSIDAELKMLRAIKQVRDMHVVDIVPTCLAAHVPGPGYSQASTYLQEVALPLFDYLIKEGLSNRIDAFVEHEAFDVALADDYFTKARTAGFDITVHADQFSVGGSELAVKHMAASADHLEASGDAEIKLLAASSVVATVLPGASLGLGMHFAPARRLLDSGCIMAIASDWNPGSAPMGDLLTQAALLSAYQKLTTAETLSGITFRAAKALRLLDRGVLSEGKIADIVAFPVHDYREILYHQGMVRPSMVWKYGKIAFSI